MWRCKKCGGDIMKEYTESSRYEVRVEECDNDTASDLSFEDEEIRDTSDEIYFECEKCSDYIYNFEDIEEIADWIE